MEEGKNLQEFSWKQTQNSNWRSKESGGSGSRSTTDGQALHWLFVSILIGYYCPVTVALGQVMKSRNENRILRNQSPHKECCKVIHGMKFRTMVTVRHGVMVSTCMCMTVCVCDSVCVAVCACVCVSLWKSCFQKYFYFLLFSLQLPGFLFFFSGRVPLHILLLLCLQTYLPYCL